METKILQSINLIRRGGGASLNLFRYAAKSCDSQGVVTATSYGASDEHPMSIRSASDGTSWKAAGRMLEILMLLFTLVIGNAWANSGSTDYYTKLKVAKDTGNGCVYAATSSSSQPGWQNADMTLDKVTTTSSGSDSYYVWASPLRGSEFNGWDKTVSGSANPYTFSITRATSESTTTLTAQWTTYTKVNVTYNPSEDGIYSVTYQYNSYNSSSRTITAGDAENLSRNITSENGAQTIGSYYNDVITLQSVSGELQGWYSNAACTTELTGVTNNGDGTYTYVAPQSGTASVYAKYPHVDKYYGRLTASIAEVPYSMPAGGMIFISKEASAAPVYSENAQTVDNVGMGSTSLTYYLKAQPTDKRYVFRGWYSNAQCTGTPLSTNKEYTYSFTASSTNSASPTTGNIYAAFDFNLYYMQVEATTGTSSAGLGMVLVRDNNTGTPEYGEYSSSSEQFLYAYRGAPTANAYLYAKAKYGYKFSGWYDNPECTGTAIGTNNPQTYAATGTSTDPMNPDTTWLYAKFVEDATTVNITYNLPDQTKGEYTASVLDIQEIDDEYVWAFTEVFTSAGKTANTTQPQYKSEVLRLEAVCKAGYGVISWTEGSTTKTTPSRIYDTSGTAAKTLGVTFGDAKPFMVCSTTSATTGTPYATLREALDNLGSNKMIRVVQNAYVPAGDYTIPNGVRLYIPRAENTASKGKSVERSKAGVTAPTPYVTLTLGQGANIIVNGNGNIEVGAQIVGTAQDNSSSSAGCNGAISGTYGLVVMNEGSTITLNGTSLLYAWGRITGKGKITANSGTTVYEIFQVTDWCGGSRAYACNDGASTYKMFPFSQYHIQNIEVPLRLKNGANEKLMAVIDGNNADDIPLVGPNNSSSMFRMNSSDAYIEKSYDAVNDRQVYRTGGNASINDFSMNVVITVSTTSFILPLTNNMSVYIESGTTSITTNAIVNADARIHIAEGATLEMASGKSLYVYDSDDWLSGFVFNGKKVAPLRYSLPYATSNGTSSGTPIRTDAKIEDATILVNGTLNMKGKLYTSSGNAKIYSTATGKVIFSNAVADANTTVYHLNTISGSNFFASVATTYNTTMYPAKLQNGDGSFVMTANAAANDQFIYSKNSDKWMKNPKTITWNANGGTTEATTMAYSQGQFLGELPAAYRDGYTLAGWFTAASGGTQIAPTTKVTANATYYAHWTPKQYDITYMDQGKVAFSGTHVDEPNAPHPTKHTYGTTTTLNGVNNKTGYDFGGWHTISNCKESSKVTSLSGDAFAKDITLYAKWIPQTYSITYKDKGDAAFSGISWASTQPTNHTYGTATTLVNPTKENYIFDGWYTSSDCSTGQVTSLGATDYSAGITLYAKWNETTHTVTVSAGANGSVSPAFVSGVGAATASGNITATPNIGYNFSSWTLPDGVTAASGYTTSSNPIHINATADDKTITANWSAVTYNLTYEGLNGATNSNPSIYTIETATISLADPGAREGYTFTGWTCGGNSITQIALGSTGNKTITATWTINKYKVTFDSNGGNAVSTIEQDYNTAVTAPADPTREGYTFAGWNPAVPSPMPASNTNCVAQWTANTNTAYTVKHFKEKLEGGYNAEPDETDNLTGTTAAEVTPAVKNYSGFTSPATQTVSILANGSRVVTYNYTRKSYNLSWVTDGDALTGSYTHGETKFGATITAPSTPTKTGYTFNGWTPAKAETMPAAATTYTATWTANTNTAYAVEHYWQNIADNEYTKHETVNMTGTTATATAAVAKSYTGFDAQSFSQGTIAPDGSTVVKIYYNRKTYTITWEVWLSGNKESSKVETLRYGATPSYGSNPTKEQSVSHVYSFSGWTPEPYAVNKDQTYTGSFNVSPRPYTIRFVNDNGVELWHSDFGYGSTPSYGGSTPVSSHTGDGYAYEHTGWKPAVAAVTGTATYTTVYSRSADAIVVKTPETVVNNTIAPTTTVEDHGTLTIGDAENDVTLHTNVTVVENGGELVVSNGSSIVKEDPSEESIIIVESGGQLNVEVGGSVEADVFIIEATTEEQGTNPEALEEVQVSGELSETGSKNVSAIYYDLTRKHGTENFLARVWYAVAVPWAVEVPNYANGGVFIKRGEEFVPQRLGATFDLLSYDGECRATNGASANCWVYLEDEIAGNTAAPVMVPGKLYMIYLTEETSTIRFKKKAGEAIHTNTLTVSAYGDSGNDANWNGIANPATYRAYMNVSVQGLVQKFVPGTQPRDGGSYLPLDLDDKQAVGQPFFVQVDPSVGTEASVVVTRNNNSSASAPRRVQASDDKEVRYAIGIAANGKLADRLYIQTAEEKEDRYVIGKDMSKMGVSSYVAQMWVARYDSKLCLNTMALTRDKANYPLGISVPQAGEYMIFAPTDIASGDNIYLTLDNRVIWNLTMSPYYASLEQGTTTRYGLRLVRNTPAVQTGVDETQSGKTQCMKVIMDDHVYILRGEELYTITGQKAK